MIFNSIVNAINTFFTWALGFFPETNPDIVAWLHDGIYNMKTLVAGYNWIFPVDTFYTIFTAFVLLGAFAGVTKLIRWIGSIFTGGIVK